MRGILLDTNVLSELTKPKPEPLVVSFVAGLRDAWLSVLTLHELRFGLARLPPGRRRTDLSASLSALIEIYRESILQVDAAVAERAADLRIAAQQKGRVLHLADALIAGTCVAHDLRLATRNELDFSGLPVSIQNPWT